jgi:hypothetical protein
MWKHLADIPVQYQLVYVVSFVPTAVNATLILLATEFMPTVAAKAINATTNAYSIRSWPQSSWRIRALRYHFVNNVFIDPPVTDIGNP